MGHLDGTPAARPTAVRFVVLAWLCAAAVIAYIHRSSLAVPADMIRDELGLTLEEMGQVLGIFYFVYACFQVPAGWVADRWGTRLALPVCATAWSVATAVIGLANGYWTLLAANGLSGAAQAAVFPCSVKALAGWFPPARRALPTGLLSSAQQLGGAAAASITGRLLRFLSWHAIFPLLSGLGVVWAVGFFAWFRERPREHPWVNEAERELIEGPPDQEIERPAARPPTPWAAILTNGTLGLVCLQQFFRAVVVIFYLSWFPTYLQKERGVSPEESGYLASLPLLALVVGLPPGGFVIDWIYRRTGSRRLSRQVLSVVCMSACGLFTLGASEVSGTGLAVLLLAAGMCVLALGGPTSYVATMDLGGRHVGTIFSIMNTAGSLGASAGPVVVAKLVQRTGSWHPVLWLVAGACFISAACWPFMRLDQPVVAPAADMKNSL